VPPLARPRNFATAGAHPTRDRASWHAHRSLSPRLGGRGKLPASADPDSRLSSDVSSVCPSGCGSSHAVSSCHPGRVEIRSRNKPEAVVATAGSWDCERPSATASGTVA
jgi:hypothetical protein